MKSLQAPLKRVFREENRGTTALQKNEPRGAELPLEEWEWLSQTQSLHSWSLQPDLQLDNLKHIPNRSLGAKILNIRGEKNPTGSMTILVLQHMIVKLLPFLVQKSHASHPPRDMCTLLPPLSP